MSPKYMFWVAFEIQKKKRFAKENLPTNQLKTTKTSVEKGAKDRSW